MALIDDAKILIGITGTSKDALLTLLKSQCETDFKDYCNRSTIPDSANGVILNMLLVQYNRLGSQGITNESYSSISQTFTEGYPDNIIKQLNHYRKLKLV